MSLLSNGQYKIFNTQFPTQDADLYHGQPTANVVGYVNNSYSFNMVWDLKNATGRVDQFTLTNVAPSANGAYASIDQTIVGANVHGSSNAVIWTLIPTDQVGHYWILAPSAVNSSIPSGLVWSLANGQDTAPITLMPIASGNLSQVWTFERQGENGGNMARGIDDLD